MVTGSYYPEVSGGGLQVKLLKNFIQNKFNRKVYILTTTYKKIKSTKLIYRILVKKNLLSNFFSIFKIFIYFIKNQKNFSIVYLRGFTKKNFLIILLSKFFNKFLIYSPTRINEDDLRSLKKKYFFFCIFFLIDRFLLMNSVFFNYPKFKKKSFLFQNPVNFANFYSKKKINKYITISTIGFFSKIKNTKLLYLTWKKLFLSGLKIKIYFIGKVKSKYYLADNSIFNFMKKDIHQNKLNNFIKILGEVKNPKIYLKKSNIFILPSTREGFNNSVLEAMASKNAVIVTDIKEMDCFTHNLNCLKVKKNSQKDLIKKIKILIYNNEIRESIALNGQRFVKENFDINSKKKLSQIKKLFFDF